MTDLPAEDHFIRAVTWTRVRKDENDNPIGILPQAFERREDEDGLSVNWLERLPGTGQARLKAHLALMRTGMTLGAKARLVVVNVQRAKDICTDHGSRIRIVHSPENGNEPHSEIRRIPREDMSLLARLAEDDVYATNVSCGSL